MGHLFLPKIYCCRTPVREQRGKEVCAAVPAVVSVVVVAGFPQLQRILEPVKQGFIGGFNAGLRGVVSSQW